MPTQKKVGQYYQLNSRKIPQHIAIIMDGNRRWAREKGLTPTEGHKKGAENLVTLIDHCEKIGVKYLTVYALSTENWKKRAKQEVEGIFSLLIKTVKEKKKELETMAKKANGANNF